MENNIILYPRKVLLIPAKEITEITPEIKLAVDKLRRLMYKKDGYGVAAPQIDFGYQIFIMNPDPYNVGQRANNEMVCINPTITEHGNFTTQEVEGCLSIPNFFATVERFKAIKVKYLNLDLEEVEVTLDGSVAPIIFQHELDHLRGKLIVDYATDTELTAQKGILTGLEKQEKFRQYQASELKAPINKKRKKTNKKLRIKKH